MKTNPIVIFLTILISSVLVIAFSIVLTYKELSKKKVLTPYMIEQLPWIKQRSADFLIRNGHLHVAPPLIGRKLISKIEAEQRNKDIKNQIRVIEDNTQDLSRKQKFDKLYIALIRDFYNMRSIAKGRYLMADIKSTEFKYNMNEFDELSDITVTVEYSFVPIEQKEKYHNDTPGLDVKDFLFKCDGESWITVSMIDFS